MEISYKTIPTLSLAYMPVKNPSTSSDTIPPKFVELVETNPDVTSALAPYPFLYVILEIKHLLSP